MPILRREERIGRALVGRYRVDAFLGEGAMGTVFAAEDLETRAPVAIKLLTPELADHPMALRRFFQEARAAAAIRHPNVIEVYDLGESEDGLPFLVLERLHGEPFSAYLKREAPLHPQHALAFTLPVIDALRQAHAQGIIHRDLKPENLYLDVREGGVRPVLLDFGIAKLADAEGSLRTVTGTLLGTPGFMAPEQITSADQHGVHAVGPSVDVWAMSMVLYVALTGALPFKGPMPIVFARTVAADVPAPAQVPAPLASALLGGLRRSPSERYPSADALLTALLEGAWQSGVRAADPRRA